MDLKILLSALISFTGSILHRNEQAEATAPRLSAQEQAAILASTLQIAMCEHATKAGGSRTSERGLGTLVSYGHEALIVTHDRWASLTPDLQGVELRNARGALLVTVDAYTFRSQIIYRDGGSLLLRPPAGLHGVVPAPTGTPAGSGDTVWLVRRAAATARATVELVAAAVAAVDGAAAPASMRLRTLDGSVVLPADSGGGVWANGHPVACLWLAGVRENRRFWSRWRGGANGQAGDQPIAALHPLGN